MNAPARLDEFAILLGTIGPVERELRDRLRGVRNAASALIASTECSDARALAWMASDCVTECLFAPADEAALRDLAKYVNRLMLTALQAEHIHLFGAGG